MQQENTIFLSQNGHDNAQFTDIEEKEAGKTHDQLGFKVTICHFKKAPSRLGLKTPPTYILPLFQYNK